MKIEEKIQCQNCENSLPVTTYAVNILALPAASGDHDTIEECLETYSEWEPLPNYQCRFCGQRDESFKKSTVAKTNELLVFHLNRGHEDIRELNYPFDLHWDNNYFLYYVEDQILIGGLSHI